MLSPRFLLFAVLVLKFSYEVSAMDCSAAGIIFHCPTGLDNQNKVFCCKSGLISSVEVCCDVEDFLKENTGILAGIIVGALLILIIITLCCCCFCSCCCLAKRRLNRGTVLYGPVTPNTPSAPSASYQVVHPPPSQIPNPPPYYQSANPNYVYQPPANPDYKY
ncbi:hypothetical protein HNY73_002656 [Argiope bruennichi]|uniref:Uncharacterized protein n=2 Tax=Argiope bruennichi TaxID=94029 RepID=A0A8T0FWZ3_ARGBR|nr:hypothetical protein HNY73_002656 [Argiope bruennichi]